jgi:hypothetical protein
MSCKEKENGKYETSMSRRYEQENILADNPHL